jgi:hypothetical protein
MPPGLLMAGRINFDIVFALGFIILVGLIVFRGPS